jgi:hypothetical protein
MHRKFYLAFNPQRRSPLRRPKWEYNIKMNLTEIGPENIGAFHLTNNK